MNEPVKQNSGIGTFFSHIRFCVRWNAFGSSPPPSSLSLHCDSQCHMCVGVFAGPESHPASPRQLVRRWNPILSQNTCQKGGLCHVRTHVGTIATFYHLHVATNVSTHVSLSVSRVSMSKYRMNIRTPVNFVFTRHVIFVLRANARAFVQGHNNCWTVSQCFARTHV